MGKVMENKRSPWGWELACDSDVLVSRLTTLNCHTVEREREREMVGRSVGRNRERLQRYKNYKKLLSVGCCTVRNES
jgi:hypothetical protein